MTNTKEKARPVFAYCSRGGVVSFGCTVPRGAVKLAYADEVRMQEAMGGLARWSDVIDAFILDAVERAATDEAASAAAVECAFWLEEELYGREAA